MIFQHNFHRTSGDYYPKNEFCTNVDFETFQQVNGGGFIELPAGYERLHPGYSCYRMADGMICGISER